MKGREFGFTTREFYNLNKYLNKMFEYYIFTFDSDTITNKKKWCKDG